MPSRSSLGPRLRALVAGLVAWLVPTAACAIINPDFTPSDLVRKSDWIARLEAAAPEEGRIEARIASTLSGEAPAETRLVLEVDEGREISIEEVRSAFGSAESSTAVLALFRDGGRKGSESPSGAIQIGVQWFAVYGEDGAWRLGRDPQDLVAVWGGSAEKLIEAVRYAREDPGARFPVRAEVAWRRDLALGTLPGPARGAIAVDLGPPLGLGVVVLSRHGDRLIRIGSRDEGPADATEDARLTTASSLAVPVDLDGDGRIDLASWDGEALVLATQAADGTFSARAAEVDIPGCRSLDAIDAGGNGTALLAGTPRGPVLVAPDGKGGLTERALEGEAPAEWGPSGLCVAADCDGDGRCDIVQIHEKGVLFRAGAGAARFAPPRPQRLAVVPRPGSAVCGDYDADGHLDLIVAGGEGFVLLAGAGDGSWSNRTEETGELAYHGNASRSPIVGCAPCDVNNDGRQSVALLYPDRVPMLFFNRGFACFGWARRLDVAGTGLVLSEASDPFAPLEEPEASALEAARALQHGQEAGTVADLDGDGVQDLLAVDREHAVWALFAERETGRALGLTLSLSPAATGPWTVTVRAKSRRIGMHVLRPGIPVFVGRESPGPLDLEWKGPGGAPRTRRVIVLKPTRAELVP